jgi:hypothetical protein
LWWTTASVHKRAPEGLEAMEIAPEPPRALMIGVGEGSMRVGEPEVSCAGVTCVANHPQSLWITLWTGFRRVSQVTYRKGFFQFCSSFERRAFCLSDHRLSDFFPLSIEWGRFFDCSRVTGAGHGG